MTFFSHPFWSVGFRPFFSLACLSGMALPLFWALMYSGEMALPQQAFSTVQWHAHEMFFGFGWAVLGGFLLTASKNWVQIRGYHGAALALLTLAWLVERIAMWFGGSWPAPLFLLCVNAFLGTIVAMLVWTLVRHHRQDTYKDNIFFMVVLPLFALAKYWMLQPAHFHVGVSMTLGLFRMAFLLMLERTLTQFMKAVFQVDILRHPVLDNAIKGLGLGLVFESLLPTAVMEGGAIVLAALLLFRLCFWHPFKGLRRIDIGVMYLGYVAIVIQLLLLAAQGMGMMPWVGSMPVHVFTFGAMGLIIPAMLIRIAKGHTGRKVMFDAADRAVLWIMIAGFVFRIVAPQLGPERYPAWVDLAAACWLACFAILAWRYVPFLIRPRVDGKEH
ncbi:MAG: NnrS family protein [Proteobacteria bacterium]|nr:NnrS family protein [Pseudomonadota bacterium]HQR04777.1 NnrS family protein [Rhodocyclaceae bacterium]